MKKERLKIHRGDAETRRNKPKELNGFLCALCDSAVKYDLLRNHQECGNIINYRKQTQRRLPVKTFKL
jgi:hypothetical protein